MSGTTATAASAAASQTSSIGKGDYVTIGASDLTWLVKCEPYKARRGGRFVFGESLVVDLQSGQTDRWRHAVQVSTLTLFASADT